MTSTVNHVLNRYSFRNRESNKVNLMVWECQTGSLKLSLDLEDGKSRGAIRGLES